MKRLFKLTLLLSLVFFISLGNLSAQKDSKKLLDWYNKDVKSDKAFGISAEKAYKKLLKGRTPKTVVVAVIDGGTDVNHEDLQGVIWTNPGEIAGNGIDDDKNGYIDDIHGWNFIGNAKGENVNQDNLELTRIYRNLKKKFENVDPKTGSDDPDYKFYKEIKSKYDSKYKSVKSQYPKILEISIKMHVADSIIVKFLGKKEYTIKDLKEIKTEDKDILGSVATLKLWMERGIGPEEIKGYVEQLGSQFNYQLNVDFDPRTIIGDNYEVNSSPYYGNNDVAGPNAFHGTFVAGNIGAVRNNGKGANGVAGNVKMMIVRVVPDGDERDKDVANGILYAINNGAKVINMSFGKSYSPQKRFVDSVLRLVDAKDVVLVHAAGNDAENNDIVTNYPENRDDNNNVICKSWISVGASSIKKGEELAAGFSNYGKKNVDVFAPGVDLYGLEPGNKYGYASGTSMAGPVVAGLAAVLRGYFPELTAVEVHDIIIKSVVKYDKEVIVLNANGEKKPVPFSELCASGGIVNLYNAVLLAEETVKAKKK